MKKEKLKSKLEKLMLLFKRLLTCKYLYYFAFVVLAYIFYYMNLKKNNINLSDKYLLYFNIGSSIVVVIFTFLLLFNNKFKDISISRKYLIIGIVLGLTYTFAAPVFSQSDESFHYIRAYQISSGHFISPYDENFNSYDEFPESIFKVLYDDDDRYPEYKNYEDSFRESKIKLNKNKTVIQNVRASNYMFLNYLPHSFGIKTGMIFNLSPYAIALLGRITNMIICMLIISYSLKILPIHKKALAILLLSPSVISYTASLSADGLVVAMSLLLISMIVKYIYEKPKLNWKNYIALLITVIFVSTCKTAYLPLIGITIMLPYECFAKKKSKWLFSCSLILIGIICSYMWLNIGHISIADIGENNGLSKYIHFLYVFVNTFLNDAVSYVKNIFAGNYMYQCQVNPIEIIPISYLILFLISMFSEKNSLKIRFLNKLIVSGIAGLIIILIAYALFIGNTEADSILINGIQGRYFVPVILLIPFFKINYKFNIKEYNLINISLILNIFVLFNMINVFVS